jgi:hypothetical protein
VNVQRLTEQLPLEHLQLLLLHGAGIDDAAIAVQLDIPVEAFQPMLEVAQAKVVAALDLNQGPPNGGG